MGPPSAHGEKITPGIFARFSSALIFLGRKSGAEVNGEVSDSKSRTDFGQERERMHLDKEGT